MKILAKLYKYNANTQNKNTGDCVARSISLALGMDYDEVKRGLKKVGHEMNLPGWNYFRGFTQYIREQVGYDISWRKPVDVFNRSMTVEEFSQELNTGTYLILCGKVEGAQTHMVACIDGNYYDSWDSSNRIVSYFMVIDDESQSISDGSNVNELSSLILDEVDKYIDKLNSKVPYFHLECGGIRSATDEYTRQFTVVNNIHKESFPESVKPFANRYRDRVSKIFYIKMNPSMSDKDNIKKNVERLRYQIREWNYANRKTVEDKAKEVETSKTMNKEFRGDLQLLSKIPKEYQPYIVTAIDNGSSNYSYRYEMGLYALPDDPYEGSRGSWVTCYGDNLRELVDELKSYFNDYQRNGYDF